MQIAEPLAVAIEELSKLPSIGKKTAQRLALFILKLDDDKVNNLLKSIKELKTKLKSCSRCNNLSEDDLCEVCKSTKRDKSIICVVEEASNVIAIEKTHEYSGLYHVLGGVLSPLTGITPDSLKIKELLKRFEKEDIKEYASNTGLKMDSNFDDRPAFVSKSRNIYDDERPAFTNQ